MEARLGPFLDVLVHVFPLEVVEEAEVDREQQQAVVEKAYSQWNDLQNAVQEATQIAQELHNEGPSTDEDSAPNDA